MATTTGFLPPRGITLAGGAYDYIVDGKMIGGFAVVAYPAEHRQLRSHDLYCES